MNSINWKAVKNFATVAIIAGLVGALVTMSLDEDNIQYVNSPPPVLFTHSMDTTDVAVSADSLYLWLRDGRFINFFWKPTGRGGFQLQTPAINPDTIGVSDSIALADSIAKADSAMGDTAQ